MSLTLGGIWRKLGFKKSVQLSIMRIFNDEFLIGLTGIFFNDKGEVLLVKHSYREIAWGLPGGYLKAKEHPTEGLEREIAEETGFVVSVDKELKVRTDRATGRLDMCYMGKFIGGEFRKSKEVTDYGLFSFDKIPVILKDQVIFIDYALQQWKKSK
jgi:8-oxo-dGTP diphosphatase